MSSPKSTSLPDDLLVSCFARISRLYYPTLSLVSKSFRSLIASPELYQTRSSLDSTESCLYVCLRVNNDRWFTLCRTPDQPLTNKYVLAALPSQNSPRAHWLGLVALGSNIYKIGDNSYNGSSSVSVLYCRSNTWHEAPSMQMKRRNQGVSVLDGKIYVTGGCKECNSATWMEVFDPKTQAWEFVSGPKVELLDFKLFQKTAVIDGKLYIGNEFKGLAYDPKNRKWENVGKEMTKSWSRFCYCVD